MIKIFDSVQKQIGIMITLVGIAAVISNIIDGVLVNATFIEIISPINVWLLFLMLIPFIFSIFVESNILKVLQIGVFLITGFINILESFDEIYGPGMFFAAWLLMRHYGFFDKYQKIKSILFLVLLVGLTQISVFLHNDGAFDAGSQILIYTAFIILLVIIIWKDIIKEQSKLRSENKSLKINYTKLRDQLNILEKDHIPYDLKSAKISPAEERVIKTLTIYKASNREIAERLNIAESTVKLHLYNIYNKIGVDNRFAIIDLCKYNYT